MRYQRTVPATFVSRENRFVATVLMDGEEVRVHVKNTGRCREILVPGAEVTLSDSSNPGRRYRYDLVAVRKGDLLINIDSQAPNAAFGDYVRSGTVFGPDPRVYPEHVHGDSRFDFYVESGDRRIFAEVKGVTLESDGVAMFPDAPTERGTKHLRGLEACVSEGFESFVVFVIQMPGMRLFAPNEVTDPEFAREFRRAVDTGVGVMCLGCDVEPGGMRITHSVPWVARIRRPRSSWSGPSPGGS